MFIYLCVVRCLFAAVQRSYVFLAVCFVRHPLSSLNVALVFTTTTVATHNRSHRQIVFRFYCNCHDFYLILKFAELNWTVGRIIKGAFPQSLSFFFFFCIASQLAEGQFWYIVSRRWRRESAFKRMSYNFANTSQFESDVFWMLPLLIKGMCSSVIPGIEITADARSEKMTNFRDIAEEKSFSLLWNWVLKLEAAKSRQAEFDL